MTDEMNGLQQVVTKYITRLQQNHTPLIRLARNSPMVVSIQSTAYRKYPLDPAEDTMVGDSENPRLSKVSTFRPDDDVLSLDTSSNSWMKSP